MHVDQAEEDRVERLTELATSLDCLKTLSQWSEGDCTALQQPLNDGPGRFVSHGSRVAEEAA